MCHLALRFRSVMTKNGKAASFSIATLAWALREMAGVKKVGHGGFRAAVGTFRVHWDPGWPTWVFAQALEQHGGPGSQVTCQDRSGF